MAAAATTASLVSAWPTEPLLPVEPAAGVGTAAAAAAAAAGVTPAAAAAAASPSAEARSMSREEELSEAAIVAHETVVEDKRFTLYKMEVMTPKGKVHVHRRYSEFRDLYDKLCKTFPQNRFDFPKKRFMGNNFDQKFLEARQKGLQEFVQKLLVMPYSADPNVRAFFFDSMTRGHSRHLSDELAEPDGADSAESAAARAMQFDLGAAEDKKASANDFTMLKVIGRGSFGKVYLGRHKRTHALYALKVLNKEAILKQNEVKHIMSERNVLLHNVHHPFLVAMRYSFQTPTKLYFVLDYVNGGELFFHLQREKRFPVARALFYAAEITSALGYMHSLNIVYRDLKPENILLDSAGHVVLTDFGLCKENIRPGESTATFCGTPEYLAPEVIKKHAYGRAVDWWCLGCVTYEMIDGLPPFYSRDCGEMYDKILREPLRFKDHFTPRAREFLAALLIRSPDQRLGGGAGDAEDVKRHAFFSGLDWGALDRKEMPAPFNPGASDPMDLRYIDPEFTSEPVPESVVPEAPGPVSVRVSDAFEGFSYVAPEDLVK